MAISAELTTLLRVLVNDPLSTAYSDARLNLIIAVAARYVIQEMFFSQTFAADVTIPDITPDPTAVSSRDESFINLVCLKSACIIDRGEAKTSASQALNLVDVSSRVDLTEIARSKIKLLEKGWCDVYDDAKAEYQLGQVRIAGAAVMTPFRLFAGENANLGYYPYENRSPFAPYG